MSKLTLLTSLLNCPKTGCRTCENLWPSRQFSKARDGAGQRQRHVTLADGGKGGGVLDKPVKLPDMDFRKSITRQRPRQYRVMLHNDDFNRREYVVKVLLKVIDNFTMEEAINCMQEAHTNGIACLVSCPQDDAERYCEGLRTNGLISTIEPAGTSGGGGPEAS